MGSIVLRVCMATSHVAWVFKNQTLYLIVCFAFFRCTVAVHVLDAGCTCVSCAIQTTGSPKSAVAALEIASHLYLGIAVSNNITSKNVCFVFCSQKNTRAWLSHIKFLQTLAEQLSRITIAE